MALTLQQLSDRAEIHDVISEYSAVIDGQEFWRLADVFTPDAQLDFSEVAGFRSESLSEFSAWLEAGLTPMAGRYFHLCAPTSIVVDGDRARAVTLCLNPMPGEDGTVLFGHWYRDELVRTDAGWRIASRRLDLCFRAVVPS